MISTLPVDRILPLYLTDPGNLTQVKGYSYVAGNIPLSIAERMASQATKRIKSSFPGVAVDIKRVHEDKAVGSGTGIILWGETSTGCIFGGSSLGKRGVSAEEVALSAANQLVEDVSSGGCVDRHLQDQLIVFMALAEGRSRLKTGPLTLHTETAIHLTEIMTGIKFQVTPNGDDTLTLECEGIAFKTRV